MIECGMRNADCGIRVGRRLAVCQHPSAVTLIELLVAVSIVAILATLLLGVAAKAAETAREARTKQLISRLHTLVIERYESYRLRRVEFHGNAIANLLVDSSPSDGTSDNTGIPKVSTFQAGQLEAAKRLAAIREMMKMEMPDRWSDILLFPAQEPLLEMTAARLSSDSDYQPLFIAQRSSLNSLYLRRYNEAMANGISKEKLLDNQNAECLYLIVMNATSDGEAPSLFKESDIGDTDEDGMPEFIDAWGNPIRWLRWAPGFDSDLQINVASLKRIFDRPADGRKGPNGFLGVESTIANDHDPFDLFRVDKTANAYDLTSDNLKGARGWRLVPLIFSAGADELTGVRIEADSGSPEYLCRTDPYADVDPANSGGQWLGEPANNPDAVADNLTNHHITAK